MVTGLAAVGTVSAATLHKTTGAAHTRKVRVEAKLTQAVRDGTITNAQESALKTEFEKLKTERKAAVNKSSTKEQRQAERTKLKAELKTWANDNKFPLSKIFIELAS